MALTPEQQAAKDKKAAEAQAAKDEKAAKKKAAEEEKAAKAAAQKATRIETVKQNGIPRPNKGKTLRIWEIADEISKETKAPATRKAVTEKARTENLELGTIHTQYGRWRKFHGLSSIRSVDAAEKGASSKAAPEAKPLTKAQQKAADKAAAEAAGKAE